MQNSSQNAALRTSYFNDIVEEEKVEEDQTPQILSRRQAKFLNFKDKNEFNKKPKRNKS